MNRTLFTLLTVIVFSLPAAAGDNDAGAKGAHDISWGVKLGFTSCSTYLSSASIDGVEFENYTQNTQLGNFMSAHVQYGRDRFFLQTGLGISLNKSAFTVDLAEHDRSATEPEYLELAYRMAGLTIPVQAGFNIVNQEPYHMSLYAGPSMRIQSIDAYECKATGGEGYTISEIPRRVLFGTSFGFNVQTGRTFFNMEYEIVLSNISKQLLIRKDEFDIPYLQLGRRMGIFSFSYGVLF